MKNSLMAYRKKRLTPKRGIRRTFTKKATKTKIPKSLLRKADIAYSLKIRGRDKHCQYPGCTSTKKLQNSHYHGRAIKNTRFDDDNCVALCYFHHFGSKDLGFEYQKQTKEKHGYDGQYTLWMKKRLGAKRFLILNGRSKQSFKLTRDFLEQLIQSLSV